MAVIFETKTPKKLLAAYKAAVDEGRVTTWSYDKDGDFTHTAEQWVRKAWLRPRIREQQALVFFILGPSETRVSTAVYAVYHGRLVESVLRHCDGLFASARVTSMPDDGDIIG